MNSKILTIALSILCLFVLTWAPQKVHAEDATRSASIDIYDQSADGAKQISDALMEAKKKHKRVLLDFGANWCIWCRRLHTMFETNKAIKKELKGKYVVVMVDVNKERNKEVDAKYGTPTRLGLPVIVILDSDGKQLTTQDSGKLEEGDHHSAVKVMEFLKEWHK